MRTTRPRRLRSRSSSQRTSGVRRSRPRELLIFARGVARASGGASWLLCRGSRTAPGTRPNDGPPRPRPDGGHRRDEGRVARHRHDRAADPPRALRLLVARPRGAVPAGGDLVGDPRGGAAAGARLARGAARRRAAAGGGDPDAGAARDHHRAGGASRHQHGRGGDGADRRHQPGDAAGAAARRRASRSGR